MSVHNFHPEQCEQIRRQLDAYLSHELPDETAGEVTWHLESCEECSRDLASRVQLREALRKAVTQLRPPDELKDAIQQRLRRAQPSYFGGFRATKWGVALAGLAIVILAAVVGQQWRRLQQGKQIVASVLSLGLADHLSCTIQRHNYLNEGRPPDQLRERLGVEYAALLDVVQQRLPGYQVLESHQCSVPGIPRNYVHFISRGQGTILSVILTKRAGENLPDGTNLYSEHRNGLDVEGFQANDYFGFVVSNLGRNEMLQIAAGLAPAIRSALPAKVGALGHEVPAPRRAFLSTIAKPAAGRGESRISNSRE